MTDLGLSLPLRIRQTEESVVVLDSVGRSAAYIYVCAEPERRRETKRLSPAEGIEVAKIVARALTDRLEGAG